MAKAKAKEIELTATEKFAGKVENWLSKNLKVIAIACAALVVVIIVASVVTVVANSSSNKQYEKLATVMDNVSELKVMSEDNANYAAKKAQINADASALAAKGAKNYPGAKANLILADDAYDAGDYATAIKYYDVVASAQSKTYLGQVALMSKAAALEEQGNTNAALDVYNKVFNDYGVNGVYASRALFNTARCYEAIGQVEVAKATYAQLVGEFGDTNSEFAKLAESRISQLN